MQEAIAEGKKTPTKEPPLSQAEYEIIKAAEAKTKGKDRWASIAAQLPSRDPDALKKLFRKAQYEVGQQKHEAAMQRAAAKQLDLGGPLALLGGPILSACRNIKHLCLASFGIALTILLSDWTYHADENL